jgi:hypothetical protein
LSAAFGTVASVSVVFGVESPTGYVFNIVLLLVRTPLVGGRSLEVFPPHRGPDWSSPWQ